MLATKRRQAIFGLLALFSIIFAACSPAAQPTATAPAGATAAKGGATPAAAQPKNGGIINIRNSCAPPHLDPHQTLITCYHGSSAGLAYDGLLMYEMSEKASPLDFNVVPNLAESWANPDPKTYTFKLRQGAKFHNIPPVNGREVTAQDAVYSFNRMSTRGWVNSSMFTMVDKWEAVDKSTVKATLKNPSASFLNLVANGYSVIVAKEAVDVNGDLKKGPVIGTAGWVWVAEEYDANVKSVLKKNPDFYLKGLPYADGIVSTYIADLATRKAAFRTKKVDREGFGKKDLEVFVKEFPEIVTSQDRSWSGGNLRWKVDRPPLSDVRVRRAISKAIDRQALIDTAYFGAGWISMGVTLPGLDWMLPEKEITEAAKRDVAEAKKLLTEAGYDKGFNIEMVVAGTYDGYTTAAELVQDQLKEAGINVTLKMVDSPTYTERILTAPGDFSGMFLGPWGMPTEATMILNLTYKSDGSMNTSGHKDPKLDKMIEEQETTLDPAKRKEQLLAIQRYLLENLYTMNPAPWSSEGAGMRWPYLKGIYNSAASDFPSNRYWYYAWLDK